MSLSLVTAPGSMPVTVAEVALQVRFDLTDESDLIDIYIAAITAKAESRLKRALITQTWKVELFKFPADSEGIPLFMGPVSAVNSVKYLDVDGDLQTLSDSVYSLVNDGEDNRPRVILDYDQTWPSCREQTGSVVVEYVAGYGVAAAVPNAIKAWILINVATLYENRETVVVGSSVDDIATIADSLLDGCMVVSF